MIELLTRQKEQMEKDAEKGRELLLQKEAEVDAGKQELSHVEIELLETR